MQLSMTLADLDARSSAGSDRRRRSRDILSARSTRPRAVETRTIQKLIKGWDEPLKRPDVAAPDKKVADKPAEHFQKLLQARLEMAAQEFFVRYELFRAGANEPGSGTPVTLHMMIDASKHLLKAELELSKNKRERLEALERHLKYMKEIANITEAQYKVERIGRAAFASALYEQFDAEIELEREKTR
jgi:hypothetical protein